MRGRRSKDELQNFTESRGSAIWSRDGIVARGTGAHGRPSSPGRSATRDSTRTQGRRPSRSHRLLDIDCHGGLALPNDHAGQGRLLECPPQPRGAPPCQHLGSGEGRGGRQSMQILWRGRCHARAWTRACLLGKRQHSADRYGCWNPDTSFAF